MRRLLLLVPLSLAGCPPPTQYLIADVTAAGAPVQDALVTADCAQNNYSYSATRTDADGRARVQMYNRVIDARRCSVTVAKPGYSTVELDAVNICTTVACPPTQIDLRGPYASVMSPPPMFPRDPYDDRIAPPTQQPREYAPQRSPVDPYEAPPIVIAPPILIAPPIMVSPPREYARPPASPPQQPIHRNEVAE